MLEQEPDDLTCSTCGRTKNRQEFGIGALVRDSVLKEIHETSPDWTKDQPICYRCLNRYRAAYVRHLLEAEKGELSTLEEQVISSLQEQEAISTNINEQFEHELTFGERLSDRLAEFGGSWTFLIIFGSVLITWVGVNSLVMTRQAFDPYPYILLNLILSCLAAVQAPIILMSQNREESKDRLRSEHDYRVDLKAELEVRLLHTKLDQLLTHQWQRLLEIQELQVELIEELGSSAKDQSRSESSRP